ncbi:fibronectin type III domain-containing protein [Neorhizobium alkalisoli]|uniref:fibronectin type III domain-containing protein n=1 Tax=Neorhizobium alkalisoli TaxID=528178 RepID=UPI0016464CD1|nr:fibronectin type III domain-containing protein [Neorhizobium alkalisoli]
MLSRYRQSALAILVSTLGLGAAAGEAQAMSAGCIAINAANGATGNIDVHNVEFRSGDVINYSVTGTYSDFFYIDYSGVFGSGGGWNYSTPQSGTLTATSTGVGGFRILYGSTSYTKSLSCTSVPTVPDAPTGATATAGDEQASVAFTAPSNNGDATITSYTVTSNPGGLTATGAASPLVVNGLTNGTSYTFTVTAKNSVGTGTASSASRAVTPKGSQTITFANPGAQAYGSSLSLTATADSGLPVSFSSQTSGVCTVTSAGAVSFASTGTCKIEASLAGSSAFTAATAVVQSFAVTAAAPSSPTVGSVTAGDGEATVSFTASSSDGGSPISKYTVTANPGGLTASGSTSPITVSGLKNGTSYSFTVTATNSAGTSSSSASSASVTPAATLAAPVAGGVAITVAANSSANAVTPSLSGGTAASVDIASAPSHGAATVSGLSISYTPTSGYSGSDSFTYTATNATGTSAAATVTVTVTAPAPTASFTFSPTGGALTAAMAGEDYSEQITATGGTAPLTYSLASGSLPKGMVLNVSTGELTGPLDEDTEGKYSFAIKVVDAKSASASASYSLTVKERTVTAANKVVNVAAGSSPADVNLNDGATGGPFTSADLTFVEPANAGTATIIRGTVAAISATPPRGWYLKFTPNPSYSGDAKVGYKLVSSLGTSNTGTVTYRLAYDAKDVATEISTLVENFVKSRQSMISSAIKIPGLMERRQAEQATEAVTTTVSPSAEGMSLGFSTSTAQIEAARNHADGISGGASSPFNVWIDGTLMTHNRNDNGDRWGFFGMVDLGADYLLNEKALVGVSLHYDRMTDPTDEDVELTGNGWLAGPYASLEIGKGVFWDTSLLYGGSSNDIDTAYWDGAFDTTRWMADTSLKGQLMLDEKTVLTPKLRAVYFSEKVEDYSVSNAAGDRIDIDGFDEKQFRISLGAEIARSFTLENDATLTPKLGATGGFSGIDGAGMFGSLSAGFSLQMANAWAIDGSVLVNFEGDGDKSIGAKLGASKRF